MFTDRAPQLRLDTLERRDVPAAGTAITARFAAGILAVNGTNNADTITISQTSSQIIVKGGSLTANFSAFAVRLVVVYTYNGNDTIDMSALACPVRAFAGTGLDSILGGRGHDQLYGEADDDQIDGGAGNDLIVGGQGSDILLGSAGNDEIFGDDANGSALGGHDTIAGGRGFDWLYGEAGNDTLYGELGANTSLGEFDFGFGGSGNDQFFDMPRFGVVGRFASPILGIRVGRAGVQDATNVESVVY